MTNERSKSENLIPNKHHEVVEKLEIGFNKLNKKFANLLQENKTIKQQYKNLQEKNQEILSINSDLNEKNQEILRINSDLNEQNQENLRKISDLNDLNEINQKVLHENSCLIIQNELLNKKYYGLKEKLKKRDEELEKLRQYVLNLENQKK
ncbi:hypothetical protein RclHR1_00560023 [Rhizophagus clarus]|uniref:Uncharacterized protein n=1 Tax=Rhizophagus clarus TaxID=94130 RepID=A0A2Z6RNF3_9GLOM|nr:hypothetical protein RclHR1_00560023 [Rhizophagus clarus]